MIAKLLRIILDIRVIVFIIAKGEVRWCRTGLEFLVGFVRSISTARFRTGLIDFRLITDVPLNSLLIASDERRYCLRTCFFRSTHSSGIDCERSDKLNRIFEYLRVTVISCHSLSLSRFCVDRTNAKWKENSICIEFIKWHFYGFDDYFEYVYTHVGSDDYGHSCFWSSFDVGVQKRRTADCVFFAEVITSKKVQGFSLHCSSSSTFCSMHWRTKRKNDNVQYRRFWRVHDSYIASVLGDLARSRFAWWIFRMSDQIVQARPCLIATNDTHQSFVAIEKERRDIAIVIT